MPASAQEIPAARDTAPAEALPRPAPADTVPRRRGPLPTFPGPLPDAHGFSFPVYECDRECLLEEPAVTLLELLERIAPGLTALRTGYFGGPHHLLNGPAGPGFVRLLVDGRELPALEGGQVDLARVSLVQLERVRVVRRAEEVVVDLTSRRHDRPQAYSRITGATGSPSLQLLRGIFTNGLGRSFVVDGWFDLMDVTEVGRANDRLEFQARLGWVPVADRFGVELEFSNQDVVRTGADTLDFDRRQVLLRARGNLSDGLQAELRLGTSRWREEEDEGPLVEPEEPASVVVDEAAVAVRAGTGKATGAVELRLLDGPGHPSLTGRLEAGYRPLEALSVDAGALFGSWEDFTTSELRVGASFRARPGFPLRLRADAATGTRGVPYPAENRADSVSFDAVGLTADAELGPFRLFGRYTFHRLERQLPFGDAFDRALPPGPEAEVRGLEAGLSGPVLPVGVLIPGLSPIRFEGWWRHQDPAAEEGRHLPRRLLSGRLLFREDFFDGNLEIWLSAEVSHRTQVLSARAGSEEPVLLPSYTWGGGHFAFRIGRFRFFWKLMNPAGLTALDVAEVRFPSQVNFVGIKWEFLN